MKIKRSSWHYKVVSDMCAPSMPGSLCSYMAVLLALLLIVASALALVGIAEFLAWRNGWRIALIIHGAFAAVGALVCGFTCLLVWWVRPNRRDCLALGGLPRKPRSALSSSMSDDSN